jgi:1-acyl-sn-glycerol-3-phosphate acyltransferase
MLTFSYRTTIRVMKCLPVCPWPKTVGRANIPKDEPTIYVYNHQTARAEPFFVALAAPSRPAIRFFVDWKVAQLGIVGETLKDVRNSVFSPKMQAKWGRHRLKRKALGWASRFVTRFVTANICGYKFIPVYVHEVRTPEDEALRQRVNRQAFQDCIEALEHNIPVAIAPSGGYTHQDTTRTSYIPTTLPTLAEILQRRGKTLKIIPSVVREKPTVRHGTYMKYVADRIWPYRMLRVLLDRLKVKQYERPRMTVEFLPPLTFPYTHSTKEEKLRFVQDLKQLIYDLLNSD